MPKDQLVAQVSKKPRKYRKCLHVTIKAKRKGNRNIPPDVEGVVDALAVFYRVNKTTNNIRTTEERKSSAGDTGVLFLLSTGLGIGLGEGVDLEVTVESARLDSLLGTDSIFFAAEAGRRVTFIMILPSNAGTTSSRSFTSYQTTK